MHIHSLMGEAEQLKRELTRAWSKLEEEKIIHSGASTLSFELAVSTLHFLQGDLEQYQEPVRVCMESMNTGQVQFLLEKKIMAKCNHPPKALCLLAYWLLLVLRRRRREGWRSTIQDCARKTQIT